MRNVFYWGLALLLFSSTSYVNASQLWVNTQQLIQAKPEAQTIAASGHIATINAEQFRALFADKSAVVDIDLPMPDGTVVTYRMTPKPVMAPQLMAKYPELMSYRGYDTNNPSNHGRISISDKQFSAIFRHEKQWGLISSVQVGGGDRYLSYWYKDGIVNPDYKIASSDALQPPRALTAKKALSQLQRKGSGDEIKTFRVAITASSDYTEVFGGVSDAMAELNNLLTRINEILLVDLSMQFELVANNDQLVYSAANPDPFANDGSEADLQLNQQTIDSVIGEENYDIGHLLNTQGGGLAFVGVTCLDDFKAKGYTGSPNPRGDAFYINLVLHEFGHQLGGSHTFNAINSGACTQGDQRSPDTAVEPGSGSTVMGYAGICEPQNLQFNSDPFFHAASITQIRQVQDEGIGEFCGTKVSSGNAIPQITLPFAETSIPSNTPFKLSGSAIDADGDPLSYSWEQIDAGGESGGTSNADQMGIDNGANPLFRSYPATDVSTRFLPQFDDVLDDELALGEAYPATDRTLNFALVARDNKGGINSETLQVNVITGPERFEITKPEFNENWTGGTQQIVRWNVAATNEMPINCSVIDIAMDSDGDTEFDSVLAEGVPNSGEANVQVPNTSSQNARLMISCADNIFYTVTKRTFTITPGVNPIAPVITGQREISMEEDSTYTIAFEDLIVSDPDSFYPDGFTMEVAQGDNYLVSGREVIPDTNFFGELTLDVTVNDGLQTSNVFALAITVTPVNDAPVAIDDSFSVNQDSTAILFDVLENDNDVDQDALSISAIEYTGTGTVSISDNQISYTPAPGFAQTETIGYTVTDTAGGEANATITVNVQSSSPPPPPPPTSDGGGSGGSGGGSIHWLFSLLMPLLGFKFMRLR